MKRFVILLDGGLTPTARLRRQVEGCRVIAADGGIRHAAALGVMPELWLGDFDSTPEEMPARFNSVPRIAYPQDKDLTDGEIAIMEARKRGATHLLLAGAFGGDRADHALLHKLTALRLAGEGMFVMLSDGNQEGHPVLAGEQSFDIPDGTLFSVIGFTALCGLSISGAKWPLDNIDVPLGSSLTLSNVVTGLLEIALSQGQALLIAQIDC